LGRFVPGSCGLISPDATSWDQGSDGKSEQVQEGKARQGKSEAGREGGRKAG
jgi:hypothetical protein